MAIVVVGGGAIGLLVTWRLLHSSRRVALLTRPHSAQRLQAEGLRMTRHGTVQSCAAPPIASHAADLPPEYQRPDLAILCVKGYDTADALPTLEALHPGQILTLQNGIGNEEVLAAQFGAEHIISGAITSSVQVEAPGHIQETKAGGIGLAPVGETPGMLAWGAMLGKSGFHVRRYADYRALKWSKALLNMLGNGIPAVLDMPIADVYENPRLVALERQVFLEALAVMRQRDIRPVNLPAYPVAVLAFAMRFLPRPLLFPLLRCLVGGGRGGKLPSLHADMQKGRGASEGAYLYGAVAQAARESGIAAPANAAVWQALHAIVSGARPWHELRQQPEHLLRLVQQAQQRGEQPPQKDTDGTDTI